MLIATICRIAGHSRHKVDRNFRFCQIHRLHFSITTKDPADDFRHLAETATRCSASVTCRPLSRRSMEANREWIWWRSDKVSPSKVRSNEKSIPRLIISVLSCLSAPPRNGRRMRLALDIEGCLDRFYGGYYSGECLFSLTYAAWLQQQQFEPFRLGLWRSVQPVLRVRPAASKRFSGGTGRHHRLLRWNAEGKQAPAAWA